MSTISRSRELSLSSGDYLYLILTTIILRIPGLLMWSKTALIFYVLTLLVRGPFGVLIHPLLQITLDSPWARKGLLSLVGTFGIIPYDPHQVICDVIFG